MTVKRMNISKRFDVRIKHGQMRFKNFEKSSRFYNNRKWREKPPPRGADHVKRKPVHLLIGCSPYLGQLFTSAVSVPGSSRTASPAISFSREVRQALTSYTPRRTCL
jgi:hypothetical protein